MYVQIKVTKKHIAEGVPRQCHSCPIALAVDEVLCQEFKTYVSPTGIYILERHGSRKMSRTQAICNLPKIGRDFLDLFDKRSQKSIKPFTFKLRIAGRFVAQGVPNGTAS